MRDMTQAIMSGEAKGASINTMRQNLQLDYTERLLNIVKGRSLQPAAQSVALYQLKGIEKQFLQLQADAPEANKAHIEHVLYKIKQGLDVKNG